MQDMRIDFQFDRAAFDFKRLPFKVPYPVPFKLLGDETKVSTNSNVLQVIFKIRITMIEYAAAHCRAGLTSRTCPLMGSSGLREGTRALSLCSQRALTCCSSSMELPVQSLAIACEPMRCLLEPNAESRVLSCKGTSPNLTACGSGSESQLAYS